MCQSIQQQLDAFVAFIEFNPVLVKAIDHKNWASFARIYNGNKYLKNHYDTNLEKAYAITKD